MVVCVLEWFLGEACIDTDTIRYHQRKRADAIFQQVQLEVIERQTSFYKRESLAHPPTVGTGAYLSSGFRLITK